MKEVAEMLGVAIGERFKINGNVGTWYLTYKGLANTVDPEEGASYFFRTLANLLNGEYEIVKLEQEADKTWRPTKGERYYVVDGLVFSDDGNLHTSEQIWNGDTVDYTYYGAGNCFRTRAEAKAAIPWYTENVARFKRGESWEARK